MARARNIKPGFFTDAELLECDFWVRILYEGLWVHADRRGILADSAKQLKISVFPADMVDIESGLAQLAERGLIIRYEAEGKRCIFIPSFEKHQNPHPKEPENGLPPFKEEAVKKHGEQVADQLQASDEQVASRAESLIPHPSSLNPSLLNPDSGIPHAEPTHAPAALVDEPEQPYAMWTAFCEAAEYDIGAATPQAKGKNLAVAKRLLEAGLTVREVVGCTRYLRSQSWRTSLLSLTAVESEIGQWRMAGRPPQERARASPRNGAPGKNYVELAKEADERDAARSQSDSGTHPRSLLAAVEGGGERSRAATGDVDDRPAGLLDASYRVRS